MRVDVIEIESSIASRSRSEQGFLAHQGGCCRGKVQGLVERNNKICQRDVHAVTGKKAMIGKTVDHGARTSTFRMVRSFSSARLEGRFSRSVAVGATHV